MNVHVAISQWMSGEHKVARLSFELLFDAIEEVFGINKNELIAQSRHQGPLEARHAFMFIAHEYMGYSSSEIGKSLNRHHTVVLSGMASFRNRMHTDYRDIIKKTSAVLFKLDINETIASKYKKPKFT